MARVFAQTQDCQYPASALAAQPCAPAARDAGPLLWLIARTRTAPHAERAIPRSGSARPWCPWRSAAGPEPARSSWPGSSSRWPGVRTPPRTCPAATDRPPRHYRSSNRLTLAAFRHLVPPWSGSGTSSRLHAASLSEHRALGGSKRTRQALIRPAVQQAGRSAFLVQPGVPCSGADMSTRAGRARNAT
jgi:hypothetical protein